MRKLAKWFAVIFIFAVLIIFRYFEMSFGSLEKNFQRRAKLAAPSSSPSPSPDTFRTWEDSGAFNRSVPEEFRVFATLAEYQQALYKEYGFDALLSDQISVNRSVPDVRPAACLTKLYHSLLPRTSIIIIFYNERRSVLLRTVYGILNRTPAELIEEIILVDDASTWTDILSPLDDYLRSTLATERAKVRLVRLPVRRGLIVARMEGARSASKRSEAFVFMDSHFEVNYNWLPPLLDPIAHNSKACTCAAIDVIAFDTFKYKQRRPYRGYFDWKLNYQMTMLSADELSHGDANFNEYVLMGGIIAIGAAFFWDLGGFDEGMQMWGGEQYELSFKVWMCGGEVINVPCSRMGHLFRDPHTKGNTNLYGDYSFLDHNIRRLIDVWMDEEHRQYVFSHRPNVKKADPGDISERLAIRDRLKCKSFSWMMENAMPNMKNIYPGVQPDDYGNGWIQNMKHSNHCIELGANNSVVLNTCHKDGNKNGGKQFWHYTWRCEIKGQITCVEGDVMSKRVKVFSCHRTGGNQQWYYDHVNHWIKQASNNYCMTANIKDLTVGFEPCQSGNSAMNWLMGYYNESSHNPCMNRKIKGIP